MSSTLSPNTGTRENGTDDAAIAALATKLLDHVRATGSGADA